MAVGIIIVAAGSGTRLGAGVPKAFVRLGGTTLLERCLETIAKLDIGQLVVAVPQSRSAEATEILRAFALPCRASVVVGGAERQDSVRAALDALEEQIDTVLVHDAARPFTPPEVFERVIEQVQRSASGVIPVVPVVDTLKRVDHDSVIETVDRSQVRAVQTPQGFPRFMIEESSRAIIGQHTDDAGIVQVAGHAVTTVMGDERAFKITTPDDLERGIAMQQAAVPETRVGTGTDAHAFDADSVLWLAGLEWPGETGLAGHSDGDVACHAIVDALLSAAGLGDIGGMFGTDDPRLAGAHGRVFLEGALERIAEAGWSPVNVSVQIIGNRPKFAPRREEAQELLSSILGAPVSIAATTTDGMGFTGRGEGLAAVATALIVRKASR